MRCRTCDEAPCICTKSLPIPYVRSTYHDQPKGMTRQQFGRELYDTIFVVGELLTLQQLHAYAVFTENHLNVALVKTRQNLKRADLKDAMIRLTPDETAQIIEHYPWVAHV